MGRAQVHSQGSVLDPSSSPFCPVDELGPVSAAATQPSPQPCWPVSTWSAGSAWQEQLWKPRFPVSEASVGLHQTNTKQNPGKV